jgi:aminomethyltransferase
MLAVQGPRAREVVATLAEGSLPARMHSGLVALGGHHDVLVCGTGYTGEDGVELMVDAGGAPALWGALVAAGAEPAGLGARDTLRLEACLHLYGNDLDEAHDPISAGLGWACREETGFIGADAVRAVRDAGPAQVLVAFVILGTGIARAGNPVVGGGQVTSGTLSPSLGVGIGLAYLPADRGRTGTRFEIDVRGRTRTAEVRPKPLYVRQEQLVA